MSVASSTPLDSYSYRLEHQFDRTPELRDLSQQVGRVGRIAACAILCRFPGARRIGHQRAFRGIYGHEPPVESPCPTAAKRIIPTGIKDEEFPLHPSIVHARQDPIGCDRMACSSPLLDLLLRLVSLMLLLLQHSCYICVRLWWWHFPGLRARVWSG